MKSHLVVQAEYVCGLLLCLAISAVAGPTGVRVSIGTYNKRLLRPLVIN